jgi:hypothetical protein
MVPFPRRLPHTISPIGVPDVPGRDDGSRGRDAGGNELSEELVGAAFAVGIGPVLVFGRSTRR